MSRWAPFIGLVVVVVFCAAAWFLSPKGENQTYVLQSYLYCNLDLYTRASHTPILIAVAITSILCPRLLHHMAFVLSLTQNTAITIGTYLLTHHQQCLALNPRTLSRCHVHHVGHHVPRTVTSTHYSATKQPTTGIEPRAVDS
jgi:hypothetical protein